MTRHPENMDLSPWLAGRSFEDCCGEFDERGYLIFESVLTPARVEALRQALQPYLDQNISGRNDFEGLKSNRVYALLAKSALFAELVVHPLALAFAERDLGRSCLLSACLAINLQPGESVQPWHTDDAHITIPYPHGNFGVSAFWALDDTTAENGATEVLPGSHRWTETHFPGSLSAGDFSNRASRDPAEDPGRHEQAVQALLPAGSLMVAKGHLWHRGGANRSDQSRLIVTPQYCVGWARQLENQVLAVPPELAAAYPQRVRELLGYSICAPFMGYVDGVHPDKVLATAR